MIRNFLQRLPKNLNLGRINCGSKLEEKWLITTTSNCRITSNPYSGSKAQLHRSKSTHFAGERGSIGKCEISELPAPGSPFHLAIPVHCIHSARKFYGEVLGLVEGRRAEDKWQDYSLHGHQIVCHFVGSGYRCPDFYNPVDGDEVPVPHFGLALTEFQFMELWNRLKLHDVKFVLEPHKRFQGQPGEQWTMFFKDPSGNNLEFKAMTHPHNLFAKYNVKD